MSMQSLCVTWVSLEKSSGEPIPGIWKGTHLESLCKVFVIIVHFTFQYMYLLKVLWPECGLICGLRL